MVDFVIQMLLVKAKLNEILHEIRREASWFIQATDCIYPPLKQIL